MSCNAVPVALFVEDEWLLRLIAVEVVEEAGFFAVEAANADEAIIVLESRADIAVIFTEVDMPGTMDGLKLSHAVRLRWPRIKIIVVSGKTRLNDADLPSETRFFSKPYSVPGMISELRSLVAPPSSQKAHPAPPDEKCPSGAVISFLTEERSLIVKLAFATFLSAAFIAPCNADCQIADAGLEEAILQNPRLRGPANSQSVRDLRSLRDAAFTLREYGRHDDCERLLANIRELIAGPPMGSLGDNDEDEAEKQTSAREPKVQRGAALGTRGKKDAKPLIQISELAPGLRSDEIVGAEVRSSDDKIVGEVRNIVFGTKDGRDYVIVASGGFFTAGKDSLVVPLKLMKVSQDRSSFYLLVTKEAVTAIPVMADQEYNWLTDEKWRARNDQLFMQP